MNRTVPCITLTELEFRFPMSAGFFPRKRIVSWFGLCRRWAPFPKPKGLTEFFAVPWATEFEGNWKWINVQDRCSFDPEIVRYAP